MEGRTVKTWAECQDEFLKNADAYRQGSGAWVSGSHNGRPFNFVRELDGLDVYCVFRASMRTDDSYTMWEVIGTKQAPRRDVSRQPTWCNQCVGVFSYGMAGQDLDAFEGKEYNANAMIQKLRAGQYDRGRVSWEQVPHESALAYAAAGGLVVVGADVPGGIGHVAVLQPDGLTTQAGAKTGKDIPIEVGFGKALAARVQFFACQVIDGDEDDD